MESFYDTWERLKDYERDCPHHGFTSANLLSTFYRNLYLKYQLSLDTGSNGDFTTKTVAEERALIDNLVASNNNNNCIDYDKTMCFNEFDSKQIVEVKNIVNLLLKN